MTLTLLFFETGRVRVFVKPAASGIFWGILLDGVKRASGNLPEGEKNGAFGSSAVVAP
ncbi:MAG: hypothetical protein ACP5DY_06995 [Thermovirgaceae bacterium]